VVDWSALQRKLVRKNRALNVCLRAISRVYGNATRYRLLKYYRNEKLRKRVPAKVISVGNIVAGGTGKTPVVMWLCKYLENKGFSVAVVSRGYGRKKGSKKVIVLQDKVSGMSWEEVGDEPYMLFRRLKSVPVVVGTDRYACAAEAIKNFNPDVIVMDDGFQHLRLERDVDLVLLDCEAPFDNGHLLPLGKLREPVSHLVRADAFILTRVGETEKEAASFFTYVFPGKPIFGCYHRPVSIKEVKTGTLRETGFLEGKNIVGLGGIGAPETFKKSLERLGANIKCFLAFPDHYAYSAKDVEKIVAIGEKYKVDAIVTTEKDEVRLLPFIVKFDNFFSLVIDVEFADEAAFRGWLERRICL